MTIVEFISFIVAIFLAFFALLKLGSYLAHVIARIPPNHRFLK